MIKKVILGGVLFSVLAGTALAEYPAAAISDLKNRENLKPSMIDKCLKTGISREECIKKIKAEYPKAIQVKNLNAKQVKSELRIQGKNLKKELVAERKQIKAMVTNTKVEMAGEARELQAEFQRELSVATTDEERAEIKKKFAEKRAQLNNGISNKRGELKDIKADRVKDYEEKIKKYLEKRLSNIIRKYEAYKNRAISVNERIDKKIEELRAEGYDVTKLEVLQAEGKRLLKEADVKLKEVKRKIDNSLSGELSRDEIRSAIKEIRADLIEVKRILKQYFVEAREIVKAIKDMVKENDGEIVEGVEKTAESLIRKKPGRTSY